MTKPVTIPNTFATATTAIPLSNLDADFSTVATAMNDANTYSNYAADTGSANAYVVTLTGISAIYSAGLRIQFKAGNANTTASTLNVNAQGAKNITYQDASAIASGTIAANSIVDVMYDGTQFLLMNDPAGGTGGDVVGPASATDNAIVRFDGTTGKVVQNSVVTIADSTGDISGVGQLNATTVDTTNVEVTNIKAKDGTAAASIADSTGAITVSTLLNVDNLRLDGNTLSSTNSNGAINLTPNGTGQVTVTNDALISGITVGRGAGAVSTNTAVGASALAANTSGDRNAAFGNNALYSNQGGQYNVALGDRTAYLNNSGSNNIAIGSAALYANTSGANNVAVGRSALEANTTASSNTAVGYQAGYSSATVSNMTAVGFQALYTGSYASTAVGYQAGYANNSNFNTYIGYLAGTSDVSSGSVFNVFVGAEAGRYFGAAANNNNTAVGGAAMQGSSTVANNTGTANAAFGASSLVSLTSGSNNVAVGSNALRSNTTASSNTAVGYQAGYSNTTASNNTHVGFQAGYSGTTAAGQVFVGSGAGYNATGAFNTFVGYSSAGTGAGNAVTSGSRNTILGGYSGNQGGLDIRTASNYVVLSDGDGNPRLYHNGTTIVIPNLPTSSSGLPTGALWNDSGTLKVA